MSEETKKKKSDSEQVHQYFDERKKTGNRFHPMQDWFNREYAKMVSEGVGQEKDHPKYEEKLSLEDPIHVAFERIILFGIAQNQNFIGNFHPQAKGVAIGLAYLMLEDIYINRMNPDNAIRKASKGQDKKIVTKVLLIALQTLEAENELIKRSNIDLAIDEKVIEDLQTGVADQWQNN